MEWPSKWNGPWGIGMRPLLQLLGNGNETIITALRECNCLQLLYVPVCPRRQSAHCRVPQFHSFSPPAPPCHWAASLPPAVSGGGPGRKGAVFIVAEHCSSSLASFSGLHSAYFQYNTRKWKWKIGSSTSVYPTEFKPTNDKCPRGLGRRLRRPGNE